jgi:hypothetical protein
MNCDMIYLVKDDNGSQLECKITREDTDSPANTFRKDDIEALINCMSE